MPRGYIRWVAQPTPTPAEGALKLAMLDRAVAESAEMPTFSLLSATTAETPGWTAPAVRSGVELPDPVELLTKHEQVIFFLQTAAEIEHALLVQYLYAKYSLGEGVPRDDLTAAQKGQVDAWRSELQLIAIQEMGHLVTVQNLLRLVGGPLNLDREDFPFRSNYYPFPFHLEPLSKESLAKYVAAEMPANPADPDGLVEDAVRRARLAVGGGPINRVGLLYERLIQLFSDPAGLPDTVLRPDTAASLQATVSEFNPGGADLIVATFSGTPQEARAAAIDALHRIAAEGEGAEQPAAGTSSSHFERFLEMYRACPESTGAYPYAWKPSLAVPCHPSTAPDPWPDAEQEAGRITAESAKSWALLANLRYRMLLAFLQHGLITPRGATTSAARTLLINATFGEMFHLKSLASVLVTLPRKKPNVAIDGRPAVASIPFELPYSLVLSDVAQDRWRNVLDLLAIATAHAKYLKTVTSSPTALNILEGLLADDERIRVAAEEQLAAAGGGGGEVPTPTPAEAMLQLIATKRPIAQGTHGFVPVGAGITLQQLFQAGTPADFQKILDFLRTGSWSGRKLVVAGQPDASEFVALITTGPMQGVFTDAELDIVKAWILSLS